MNNTDHSEKLNEILADLASKSHLPEAALSAYWDNIGSKSEMPDKDTVEAAEDCYIGEFNSLTHLAEHLCEETGMLSEMPERLQPYFDFEKYGRDLQLGGDVWENEGFYFFNR
jgi:antirestriction protein